MSVVLEQRVELTGSFSSVARSSFFATSFKLSFKYASMACKSVAILSIWLGGTHGRSNGLGLAGELVGQG
jgi:hypothetical protein